MLMTLLRVLFEVMQGTREKWGGWFTNSPYAVTTLKITIQKNLLDFVKFFPGRAYKSKSLTEDYDF